MTTETIAAQECSSSAARQTFERFPAHEVSMGDLRVFRALPIRGKRLIGPWCFLDRLGPHSFTHEKPIDIAPHPHTGLQTVTRLWEGEIVHKDSLGVESLLRPGGVNVMTSGRGIAHAEETPRQNSGALSGVQLWVALPEGPRQGAPDFQHLDEVPTVEVSGGRVNLFAGNMLNALSPAFHHSPLIGADVEVRPHAQMELPLDGLYEHAALVLSGDAEIDGHLIRDGSLYYLGTHRSRLHVRSRGGCRVLLIGGPPFPEKILMWWNFVARTPDEIAAARADWQAHQRFGEVRAYQGPRLDAPPLIRLASPNPGS